WVKRQNLPIGKRDYHSLEYLQYAEMQMGQYQRANAAMAIMLESAQQARLPGMTEEAAAMASRYAIETGDWARLDAFPVTAEVPELLFARGLASLKTGGVE